MVFLQVREKRKLVIQYRILSLENELCAVFVWKRDAVEVLLELFPAVAGALSWVGEGHVDGKRILARESCPRS